MATTETHPAPAALGASTMCEALMTTIAERGDAPFSVYNTSPPEQVGFVMGDAGNRVVICERQFEPVVRAAREHGAGAVEHVVLVEELDELIARGDPGFDLEAAWRAGEPGDLLTLIYTSGTTGPPKGVQTTHANVLAELRGVHAAVPIASGGRQLSYEKLKAALEAGGVRPDPALGPAVREKLGFEEVEWFVTGAAPTTLEVLGFFAALGIEICEVWGMSETTCIATTNRPGAMRPGSVGTPIDGVELRLDDDDELLVRGDIVMAGYRNRPDLSSETIDADGWLRTGDIARIDDDGYVWIVDRKKELIINAAGKNMSPANIEMQLKSAGPLIGQACVFGDRRPYNVALLVLDPEAGLEAADAGVLARVGEEVEKANASLSRVEQIKRWALLEEEWLPGGDELTPTMKLKRRPIADKYTQKIESLYS